MKQTAVEWFYQRILAKDIKSVYYQAKAMEKEQNKKSYYTGAANNWNNFDEYYNETFKSE